MLKTLVLASNNAGKLKECASLLAPLGIELVSQASLQVPECPEPHPTFLENALAKARHASAHTGLPALADDSGLCVAALGGAPGVLSARYGGEPKSDRRNNAKLVADLQDQLPAKAWFYCALVLVRHANDPQPLVADGICMGEICEQAQGEGGFGYDPHFWLPEQAMTMAQLAPEVKNRLSHRAQAMQVLLQRLKALA